MMPSQYDPTRNLFGRTNVIIKDDNQHQHKYETSVALYEVLDTLTRAKPNWKFVAVGFTGVIDRDQNRKRVATCFHITCDGETLGSVGFGYRGNGYKLVVENERISEGRTRTKGYYTEKPAKATLAIRKKFFSKTAGELFDEAGDRLVNQLYSTLMDTNRKYTVTRNAFFSKAHDFIDEHLSEYTQRFNLHEQADKFNEAMKSHNAVKKMHDEFKRGLIVLLSDSLYIVKDIKSAETVTLADNQLPESMRMKIGLLKLAEQGQVVSDVGFRISDKAMYLVPDEQ